MNLSSVVRWLEGIQGPLPYAAVLAVAFAEHALLIGSLVPGEVILPLVGVVAATTGAVAWLPAALCATVGGFLADQLAFLLARSWTIRRDERPQARPRDGSQDQPRWSVSSTADTGSGCWCWGPVPVAASATVGAVVTVRSVGAFGWHQLRRWPAAKASVPSLFPSQPAADLSQADS